MIHRKPAALVWAAAASVLLLTAGGCGGGSTELSEAEEASFRQAVDNGKGEFDINNVPEEHRERVRGIMEANRGPASSAPKTGD